MHFSATLTIFVMNSSQKFRTVVFYKDYFEKFFVKQTKKAKAKIIWTLQLIEEIEKVPESYFKHIEPVNGLYEIRTKSGRNVYRIFCFFDKGKLVILANGYNKKTQKTPKKEIEKAIKIMEEYRNEK